MMEQLSIQAEALREAEDRNARLQVATENADSTKVLTFSAKMVIVLK